MAVGLCIFDIMCNFWSTCNLEKISESTSADWDSQKKKKKVKLDKVITDQCLILSTNFSWVETELMLKPLADFSLRYKNNHTA